MSMRPAKLVDAFDFGQMLHLILGGSSATAAITADSVWRSASALRLLLGGAAVYRCGNRAIHDCGFSRRGEAQP
jgi:hypothetical protein